MPIGWVITDGVARLKSEGPVTFDEWRAAVEQFNRHPDYRPGMGVVHDWRQQAAAPSANEIEQRATYLAQHVPPLGTMRWAVVVERDVDFGMARMEQILLDRVPGLEARVFRDPLEALAWVAWMPRLPPKEG